MGKKKKKHENDDRYLVPYMDRHPLLIDAYHARLGNDVPDFMLKSPHQDSGFFFGVKRYKIPWGCVMKPADMDGHILVVGGPGCGKTTSLIAPTLKTWKGITIAIDIKESSFLRNCWTVFNRGRGKFLKVFNPTREFTCGYDPYAFLRSDGEDNLVNNVRELALSLLPPIAGAKDRFWRDAALNILTAAILYYFDLGATFTETMTGLQLSTVKELAADIEESGNQVAKMYIRRIQATKKETAESAGMDLADLIPFATDSLIRNAFSVEKKMIDWNDLLTPSDPYDVILEIPENKLEQWPQMMQLMLNQLIKTLTRRPECHSPEGKDLPPVLIMLDEFPRLGKIDAIVDGLATLRSRGVTICLALQFLSQLDSLYGKEVRQSIVAGCSYKAILNASEPEDQKYFSDMMGSIDVPSCCLSESRNSYGEVTEYGRQLSRSREPIVYPHEFATLKDDLVLMTPEGFCRVAKAPCYEKHFNRLINPPPLDYSYSL